MVHWFEEPYSLIPTPFAALPSGEKPDVFNDAATEMAMAHNILIRGLNSIYVQAPHVKPADQADFLGYARNFVNVLTVHHDGEEESFFPWCARTTGEPDVMDVNVGQHKEFHGGLDLLQEYLTATAAGQEPYDGARIVALIDAFGPALTRHLAEEIQCILDLRRFGVEKMKGIAKALAEDGQANMGKIGLLEGIVFAFLGQDATYENGIWANFPPTPPGLKSVVMGVFYYWRRSWWKFSPCDQKFMPRPEPYAKPEVV
ncbi:hypothetical protein BX600DRAFT_477184 [Xylariales sp. PMI_506]|nr:hypothetical protein BX600DRAFT_477184 [Xylariales sp. PMI_506]